MDIGRKRQAGEVGKLSPPPSSKRRMDSSTTKEAVNSFFTPASHRIAAQGTINWAAIDATLLVAHFVPSSSNRVGSYGQEKRRKIAAFDLDSTLIRTASGNRFGKNADDWMWWHPGVPKRLRQLYDEDYRIIIFSNQSGLNLKTESNTAKIDGKRVDDFKAKITSLLNKMDVPLSLYAATERDDYRKPRTGSWMEMLEHFDLDEEANGVDFDNSFYVGDAGGRTSVIGEGQKETEKKDFSSSDLDFASNVGIKFQSPDEFFLGKSPRAFQRSFDPQKYVDNHVNSPSFSRTNTQDIICLVGSPGAGKSSFYWNVLAPVHYERVNQDQLKTRDKCLEVARNLLKSGKSVAVDNTNADPETRAHWIRLATNFGVPIRCICLKSDPKLCEHNDAVRALNGKLMNPEDRTRLPSLAFASFAKRFRQPSINEGFQDVIAIEFKFAGTKEQEVAWSQYYV